MSAAILDESATQWDTAAWLETSGKIADAEGDIVTPTVIEFQREVSLLQNSRERNGSA